MAISLSIFTVLYGVLALAEARLLMRHVKAGPEPAEPSAEPRRPDDLDTEAARLAPTLMY